MISKIWMRLCIILTANILMVSLATGEELSLGNTQAPVTLIEYGSLTCGKCLYFHKSVFPQIKEHYIDQGIVRFTFRHFPTSGAAVHGARAAQCSGDKYYDMLDVLFATVANWVEAENRDNLFVEHATSLGLNSEDFVACLSDNKLLDDILNRQQAAKSDLDVIGTPTFFINGSMVRGKRSFDEMKALISDALNKDKQ